MRAVKFYCPQCNQKVGAPSDFAGSVVECPSCEYELKVPFPYLVGEGSKAYLVYDIDKLEETQKLPSDYFDRRKRSRLLDAVIGQIVNVLQPSSRHSLC